MEVMPMPKRLRWCAGALLLLMTIVLSPLTPAQAQGAVLLAVSDFGSCSATSDDAVGEALAGMDGLIALVGDISQSNGTEKAYLECVDPIIKNFKDRIRPTPGNHDYQQVSGVPFYFEYFGPNAGEPGKGWYSYNFGAWHIIVLNSMMPDWNGEQLQFLKADLAASAGAPCTLAYWHHPIFSSGAGGLTSRMRTAFKLMYAAGVDVILSGDAHHYERFAPMDPQRRIQPQRGVRQFIVGTGGASHTRLGAKWRATEARDNQTFGILRLTLNPGSYSWEFVPVTGGDFTDSGSAPCVNP
jgi:hypothetical protein